MDLAQRFFAHEFRAEFARGAKWVRRRLAPSAQLAELFAITPSQSLAHFVDVLGTHERKNRYGALGWFGRQGGWTIDWLPGRHNALEHALAQPFRYPAVLAGQLAIGCDHGGNIWRVSLEAVGRKNEVYFVDHDTDELRFIADSLETFTLLMHVMERDGRPTPEERTALVGRADLEFVTAHAGAPLRPPRSQAVRRHAGTDDLRMVLAGSRSNSPPSRPAPRRQSDPSGLVVDMLRLFLRGEDRPLARLLARHGAHRARLVRDAVVYLGKRMPASAPRAREPLQFHRVRLLCPWIPEYTSLQIEEANARGSACFAANDWQGVLDAHAIVPEADRGLTVSANCGYALQALGRHQEAVLAFERALGLAPDRQRLWSAICFSLGELERWKEMRHAARQAARFDPASSYAQQQLAIACSELGQSRQSIAAGRRAVELDAGNAFATFHLAVALARSGKTEAAALLNRALKLTPSLAECADAPEIRSLFAKLGKKK